jgi:hypothetical protein
MNPKKVRLLPAISVIKLPLVNYRVCSAIAPRVDTVLQVKGKGKVWLAKFGWVKRLFGVQNPVDDPDQFMHDDDDLHLGFAAASKLSLSLR